MSIQKQIDSKYIILNALVTNAKFLIPISYYSFRLPKEIEAIEGSPNLRKVSIITYIFLLY